MSLLHLRVHNLGLLDEASIDPSPALTVVTGETGAGKTLLLGGVRLLLGAKAESDAVGPHGESAEIEGLFGLDGVEVGANRTVPREGRSRGHIDGAIVSVSTLAQRLGSVVEVVGQHDQLALARPSHALDLVDGALDESERAVKKTYEEGWGSFREVLGRQERLGGDLTELARELDLARYQANEIASAGLTPRVEEDLDAAVSRLRNVVEIAEHLGEIHHLAEEMSSSVGEVVARLRKVVGLDPSLDELAAEGETLASSVADLARGARSAGDALEADPGALEELEDRLTALGDLKRKYGKTIEEVIDFGVSACDRASQLGDLLAEAERIDAVVADARAVVAKDGRRLTTARRSAAKRLVQSAQAHLADLGLSHARLSVEFGAVEPGPLGADQAQLTFASDSRLDPGPVSNVASGGELSRLVLALRLAAAGHDTLTLVFDEVDTGIGGSTALAMGAKLAELSRSFQVLCVTHLPQVAANADTHYVVERTGEGTARAREVRGEDRLVELSRMLAGRPESEKGRLAAAELLELVSG